jgi:TnpA family transposase
MEVDREYVVDSHGQSTGAFASCQLLGFQLLPRFKAIYAQKPYRPETAFAELGKAIKTIFLFRYLHDHQQRAECDEAGERRNRLRFLGSPRRDGKQPSRGSRNEHAFAASGSELHGVHSPG